MLPGEPGGGHTPEGVGPRVNDTRRRASAEIGGGAGELAVENLARFDRPFDVFLSRFGVLHM